MDVFTWIRIQTWLIIIVRKIDTYMDKMAHHGIAEFLTALILIISYGLFRTPLDISSPVWIAFCFTLVLGVMKDLVFDKWICKRVCSFWDIIATWSGSWPWIVFYYMIR